MFRTTFAAGVAVAAALLTASPLGARQVSAGALYDQGVSWNDFMSGVRARAELWRTNAARAEPSDEMVRRLRAAGTDLRILVIAIDACSDSVSTVPYLAKLAERAGVDLRIVNPTLGKAFMEAHRTPDGRAATPTIVLLRGDREAGVFVERPGTLQNWYLSEAGQALGQQERVDRKMSWYDWDRGDSTLLEIVALAEGAR
jgi:hypothetical protein